MKHHFSWAFTIDKKAFLVRLDPFHELGMGIRIVGSRKSWHVVSLAQRLQQITLIQSQRFHRGLKRITVEDRIDSLHDVCRYI